MDILLFSLLTNFLYFCCGNIFVINKKTDFLSQFYTYFVGVATVAFVSLFLNFFTPLNQTINSAFYSIIVLIFAIFVIKKKFIFNKRHINFLIISSFITYLLIIYSTVNRPDAGLYHLPYTSLIQENKIIIGASNIHFRFGHVSILQYLSAINNNYLFLNNGISIPAASVVSFFYIYFFYDVWSAYKKKEKINFANFFSLFILIYISFKITGYGSFGNDAIGHLCFFYIISCVLKYDLKKINIEKLLLISVIAFINKPTLGLIFIIPIYTFILQNALSIKKLFFISFSFPTLLLYLWLSKNILISGCSIFPIKITCIEKLSWTNIEQITNVNIESNAWAKAWPDRINKNISVEEFTKNLNWVKSWSKFHLKYILNTIAPFFITLAIIIFYIKIKHKNLLYLNNKLRGEKNISINTLYLPLITSSFGCIFFFLFFSIYRYGYSYIVTFISLIAIIIVKNEISSKRYNLLFKFVAILCVSFFITKNIIKIYKNNSQTIWPNIYTLDINNKIFEKKKINHGNNFFYYLADKSDNLCMYSPSPCTTYPISKNIKYIEKYTYKILTHY